MSTQRTTQRRLESASAGLPPSHSLDITGREAGSQNDANHGHLDWSWQPGPDDYDEETHLAGMNWFVMARDGSAMWQVTREARAAAREEAQRVKREVSWERLREMWTTGGA